MEKWWQYAGDCEIPERRKDYRKREVFQCIGNDYLVLCHKLYILMYQKTLKYIYLVMCPSKVTLSQSVHGLYFNQNNSYNK